MRLRRKRRESPTESSSSPTPTLPSPRSETPTTAGTLSSRTTTSSVSSSRRVLVCFLAFRKLKINYMKTMKLTCSLRLVLGENQQVPYLWRCSPSECSFWIFLGIWGSYTQCFWCISQEQWCFHCFFCSCQNSRCHLSIMGSHSRWGQPVFCWLVLQYVFFLLFLSFIELVHQFINLFFQLWLLVALLPQDSLPLEQCLSLLSSLAAKKYSA